MGVDLLPFADNWAYLKTELNWLDRLLMLAIARQRKEIATVEKVANTDADRVSAHWWKGIIAVSKPGYDDCRVPTQIFTQLLDPAAAQLPASDECKPAVGYQQQLEGRIQASAKESTVLALPSLRHYLNLTLFEKNLLLMALAPEINRRYGRLYHYLQTGQDKATASDLPTVDLVLRLLCRNDLERRRARAKLTGAGSLIDKRVLRYVSSGPSTRLNSYLQLQDEWVDYLLSEKPDQHVLFARLATPPDPVRQALPAPTPATRAVKITQPQVPWDKLILPATVLRQMRMTSQQAAVGLLTRFLSPPQTRGAANGSAIHPLAHAIAERYEPVAAGRKSTQLGHVVLLVGEAGTGKTMAAGAMTMALRQPLCVLNLKQVCPEHWEEVLASLDATRYPALLIRSASVWFGRKHTLPQEQLMQWLEKRQASPGLTFLSTRYAHTVKAKWRQQMDVIFTLPMPHKAARMTLWRQAFAGIVCSDKIDWSALAEQLKVSGGEIQLIAHDALAIAQSKNAKTITMRHIQTAIAQRVSAL
ncbi:MAG: ATPase family associated with various cellular activities (AAA) [Phormidesmis priestleyi Ana]|uniref:ATPase family associated with various cellular activities (AAA) n=1 Tax=Phormidesmis priestleyi Ana TaxID=1666911 RepID=A0A0P7YZ20_9CYAN|nr:MAG: ATPase family associated with various cellular activities (AAA) [Phormidesmis priestleyi Ana]